MPGRRGAEVQRLDARRVEAAGGAAAVAPPEGELREGAGDALPARAGRHLSVVGRAVLLFVEHNLHSVALVPERETRVASSRHRLAVESTPERHVRRRTVRLRRKLRLIDARDLGGRGALRPGSRRHRRERPGVSQLPLPQLAFAGIIRQHHRRPFHRGLAPPRGPPTPAEAAPRPAPPSSALQSLSQAFHQPPCCVVHTYTEDF